MWNQEEELMPRKVKDSAARDEVRPAAEGYVKEQLAIMQRSGSIREPVPQGTVSRMVEQVIDATLS